MARAQTLARAIVAAAASAALDLVAPPACAACDASVRPGRVFCGPCAGTVERAPPPDAGDVRAAFLYGGALAVAIRRMKFAGRADLAPLLGRLLGGALAPPPVDAVVAVPLHPRRLADRGFDQAALLAREVAAVIGRPFAPGHLRRASLGPAQASLGRAERLSRPLVFEVRGHALAGRRVLLVDDVVTTGATLAACRRALEAAGIAAVVGWCLARAELGPLASDGDQGLCAPRGRSVARIGT